MTKGIFFLSILVVVDQAHSPRFFVGPVAVVTFAAYSKIMQHVRLGRWCEIAAGCFLALRKNSIKFGCYHGQTGLLRC